MKLQSVMQYSFGWAVFSPEDSTGGKIASKPLLGFLAELIFCEIMTEASCLIEAAWSSVGCLQAPKGCSQLLGST